MTKGKTYREVVNGCGPAPVRFKIQKDLAKAEHELSDEPVDEDDEDAPPKDGQHRKIEVSVTEKGTILGRRVVYGKNKQDGYQKFDSIEQAAAGLDKSRPEEVEAKKQLGQFVEAGNKAPGPVANADGDV